MTIYPLEFPSFVPSPHNNNNNNNNKEISNPQFAQKNGK
jgi:hypothetical protein